WAGRRVALEDYSGRRRRGSGAGGQAGEPGVVEGRLQPGRLRARGVPEGDDLRLLAAGREHAALQVEGGQRLQAVGTGMVEPRLPALDSALAHARERGELPLAEAGPPAEHEEAPTEVHGRKLMGIATHRLRLVRRARARARAPGPGRSYY